ncbi:MFS transporter [Pelomonas sp. HMWF004]|nr:MFS transporter [Pelomonas sp. HMWF004]
MSGAGPQAFGWLAVLRLGLVQASLGAVVVLTTSTLNRVMVVEMALPALLPGLLLAWHYLVQVSRPRMGHGSDRGRRCTPWILGGMVTLAVGGWLAALATVVMGTQLVAGLVLALLAYGLIGLGVAASGTSLLALLAKRVLPERRAAAATTVWILMIAGFVVTAGVSGSLLDPFSPARLLWVAGGVALSAVVLASAALLGLEGPAQDLAPAAGAAAPADFRQALRDAWAEPRARRFTVFVFVSMLAFSMQDLILEPFAGLVFGLTPGATTQLSGTQHGGALVGMLLTAAAGSSWAGRRWGTLRGWTVWGCVASALALAGLAGAGLAGTGWPLQANVFVLGLCTGAFSIAAIGSMMGLAGAGEPGHEGVRMGLWGAAQALAFASGGVVGTAASDLTRWLIADAGLAYALVFTANAGLFLCAARLAARVEPQPVRPPVFVSGQLGSAR